MITQNSFLGLIAKAPTVQRETKTGEVFEKAPNKDFSDTFDKALSNIKNKENNRKVEKNEYKNNKTDNREQVRTYKDVVRDNFRELKKNALKNDTVSDNTVKSEDDVTEIKEDTKPKTEAAVNVLADVMGLNVDDLAKLFSALDIKPEDLADSAKTDEIVNKLTTLIGLNTEQKQTLESLLKLIGNQLNGTSKTSETEGNKLTVEESGNEMKAEGKEDWVKVKNVDIEVIKVPKEEFADLMTKLKAKLEELSSRLQQNPQKTMNEVADSIRKLLNQLNNTDAKNISTESDIESQVNPQQSEKIPSDKVKSETSNPVKLDSGKEESKDVKDSNAQTEENQEGNSGKKNSDNSSLSGDMRLSQHQHSQEVKINENKNDQFNQVLTQQGEKVGNHDQVTKVQKEAATTKSEIFSQVIEKAKVVTNGEKSEMVMDLKPESLGKLSLKIVTEHGIVMAKFVAENQQVKEVLESNMQLLKDSLEKQGLSVQGFSVSVEQHFSKGFNGQRETENNNKSGANRVGSVGTKMVNVAAVNESLQKPNPYNWSDSKINLTA